MLTIDLETQGLGNKPKILGIAWAFSSTLSGASEYREEDAPLWQHLFNTHVVCVFNAPFDIRVLRQHGFTVPNFVDAKLLCHAWDSQHDSYSLNDCLMREGLEVKKEFSPPGGWDNAIWSEEMEEYAEHDALQTHRLYESVWGRMQSDSKALKHYLEIEVPYQEVVLHMEANGMPLDLEKLDRVHSHLFKKVAGLRSVMQHIAGHIPTQAKEYSNKTLLGVGLEMTTYNTVRSHYACDIADRDKCKVNNRTNKLFKKGELYLPKAYELSEIVYSHCPLIPFNPNSGEHIAERLTTLYGWEPEAFTPTGKPATGAEHLSVLNYHLAQMLCTYAELQKVLSSFVEPFKERHVDGVLRGRFNQTGTRTGRLSSSEPNLQNIPAKGALGKAVRSLISAPQGYSLVDIDLSNIEGRVLAEYLSRIEGDHSMTEVFVSGVDFHQANADAWGVSRRDAKTLLFATLYGAGPEKIGGGDKERGKALLAQLEANAPALFNLKARVLEEARARGGVIHTLFGRRLVYPELLHDNALVLAHRLQDEKPEEFGRVPDWRLAQSFVSKSERQIFNALLQGTAADVLKLLTLRVMSSKMSSQLLCAAVHDELLMLTPSHSARQLALTLNSIFCDNKLFRFCPITGQSQIGQRWSEIH